MRRYRRIALAAVCIALAGAAGAQPTPDPRIGLISELVEISEILEDVDAEHVGAIDRTGLLKRGPVPIFYHYAWGRWKQRLRDKQKLRVALLYTFLYQNATDALGEDHGSLHQVSFVGRWHLIGNRFLSQTSNDGYLNFGFDRRHLGAGVAPGALGASIGSIWPTALGRGFVRDSVPAFYWQQQLLDRRLEVNAGRLLPELFYDRNRLSNVSEYFMNAGLAFNPTSGTPQTGLGASLRIRTSQRWFLSLGVHDANGRVDRSGFDTVGDGDYFYALQLATSRRLGPLREGRWRIHAWYSSAARAIGRGRGRGISLSGDHAFPIGKRLLLVAFLRYGYASETPTATRQFASLGLAAAGFFGNYDDTAGVAFGWGEPKNRSLRDQYVAEVFYRLQLTDSLRLTPSYQLIIRPSANPDRDYVGIFGIRLRIAL